MSSVYQARWNNAFRWANRVNSALAEGKTLRWNDRWIERPLIITESEILMPVGEQSTYIIFENDPEKDHGLHTSIEEFNRNHQNIEIWTKTNLTW